VAQPVRFDHGVRRRQSNGQFVVPFKPHYYGTTGGWNGPSFRHSTAWLYTYFVHYDLPGLLSRDHFNARLKESFADGHVDLISQPDLQAPFPIKYSGKL
jgi:putative alpha-1,2-mannosidase